MVSCCCASEEYRRPIAGITLARLKAHARIVAPSIASAERANPARRPIKPGSSPPIASPKKPAEMVTPKNQLKPSALFAGVVNRDTVTAIPTVRTAKKNPAANAPP